MKTSLADILSQHSVWRGGALAPGPGRTVPTGFAALDRDLPGAVWPRGALTEILGRREGDSSIGFPVERPRHRWINLEGGFDRRVIHGAIEDQLVDPAGSASSPGSGD